MAERDHEHEEEFEEVDGEENEEVIVDPEGFDEDVEEVESEFFTMHSDEEYEEYTEGRTRVSWGAVLSVFVALVLAVTLCIIGGRALFSAQQNAELADKQTWVMDGTFVDVTPDLETKDNVAHYRGTLPVDDNIDNLTYRSNIKDRQKVSRGETVDFRGSQTGMVSSDFPREVTALLVKEDDQLKVVRTGEKGSIQAVNKDLVNQQRLIGWGSFIGALLILIAGGYVGVLLTRRAREEIIEEDSEETQDAEAL